MLFIIGKAREYVGNGIPLEDLIQEGIVGFREAVSRFDEAEGVRLITYAVHWVKQRIKVAISNNRYTVRIPPSMQQKIKRAKNKPQRTADDDKLLFLYEKRCVSLDSTTHHDNRSLIRLIKAEPTTETNSNEINLVIEEALNVLRPKERDIVTMFFGLDGEKMTLEEIGNMFHLSKQRVARIKDHSIAKIRRRKLKFIEENYL